MAWCKISSLTAAVSRSLKGVPFPASRDSILAKSDGVELEGWDVSYFLGEALGKKSYASVASVLADVESWAERQG